MSYQCLLIPIMSSSIRYELKMISGLPANAPERVKNRHSDRRTEGCINSRGYSYTPHNLFGDKMGSVIKTIQNDKKSQFL